MLNICDVDLLGRELAEDKLVIHIRPNYYGDRLVDSQEAAALLRAASIINMAGENIVSLSSSLGVGTRSGARVISGVPFLVVFQMG